jgi:hypothetical protein
LLAGPQDELGILEAGDQLLAGRRLHGLPDLSRRLALDARHMAEGHPDRRPDRSLGKVGPHRGVELYPSGGDELHHEHRGERLRDRADPVDVVARRRTTARDVGDSEHTLPDHLAVAEDAGRG